jgi:hypothetical protein
MGYTSTSPFSAPLSRSTISTAPERPSAQAARSRWRLSRSTLPLLGALALCGGAALAVPGCTPKQAPPALASGERPVTGVPRLDHFFIEVNAALLAVQEGRTEEADARGALARRVGLPEAAPADVLGARLRERTARWASEGLTLELEFSGIEDVESGEPQADEAADAAAAGQAPAASDPGAEDAPVPAVPPSATLRTPGREPEPRELRLLEALAQAAVTGATVYTNMGRVRRQTERLTLELSELEGQVDTSISDVVDRERVRAKLKEAKELLPRLNAEAREVWGAADVLIALLDEAANTVPVSPARRRASMPTKDNLPPRLVPRAEPRPPPPASITSSTPAPGTPPPGNAAQPRPPASPVPAAAPTPAP